MQYYKNITSYGAKSDAKKVNGVWAGTDNAPAINKAIVECQKTGYNLFIPKGIFGIASPLLATPGTENKYRQFTITIQGQNNGPYWDQTSYCPCLAVLGKFKEGEIRSDIKKRDGVATEPVLSPMLRVDNARQFHVQGLSFIGNGRSRLFSGVEFGSSQFVSFKNCSFAELYGGIIFPGIRSALNESVWDGNNDLTLIEGCTFRNRINIFCGGTQPFSCTYRNSCFQFEQKCFDGRSITSEYRQTRGSHHFHDNLFGTLPATSPLDGPPIYFDLIYSNLSVDNNHFETGSGAGEYPEVLIRCVENGGCLYFDFHHSFTNNEVRFVQYADDCKFGKDYPLFNTLVGSRMNLQSNMFYYNGPLRMKLNGAVLIANTFNLRGKAGYTEEHLILDGEPGHIAEGRYDLNHFAVKINSVVLNKVELKEGEHYTFEQGENAIRIMPELKIMMDKLGANMLLVDYDYNDADKIMWRAWNDNHLSPPRSYKSDNLSFLGNKIIGRDISGNPFEKELTA